MTVADFIRSTKQSRILPELSVYSVRVNFNSNDHKIPVFIDYNGTILEGEYRFGDHPDLHPYFYECLYFPQLEEVYGKSKFSADVRVDADGQLYASFFWDIFKLYKEYPTVSEKDVEECINKFTQLRI